MEMIFIILNLTSDEKSYEFCKNMLEGFANYDIINHGRTNLPLREALKEFLGSEADLSKATELSDLDYKGYIISYQNGFYVIAVELKAKNETFLCFIKERYGKDGRGYGFLNKKEVAR